MKQLFTAAALNIVRKDKEIKRPGKPNQVKDRHSG